MIRLTLAAFGGLIWTMMWWDRVPLLGVIQGVLIVLGLAHEIGAKK